jgi:hypothetical protein
MSVFLAGAFVVCGGVEAGAAEWVVTQLTDNDYNDFAPHVDDSNVVWYGHDGNDYEIFLYDGSITTQLTNNSYDDHLPQIDGSNVAWYGYEGGADTEIFFDLLRRQRHRDIFLGWGPKQRTDTANQ